MMVYGVLCTSLMSIPVVLANDLQNNYVMAIDLSPQKKSKYYLEMLTMFTFMNIVCVLVIGVAGILINQVKITPEHWVKLLIGLPILGIPFVLFGVAISLVNNYNLVSSLSKIIFFPAAIFGGLWWPLEMLPKWMQHIGKLTPVNAVAKVGLEIIRDQKISMNALYNIISWVIIASILIHIILKVSRRKGLK
ncbi:MAG: ABC transporter permease [Lactobacillus sp.]|nr:ABC transporter permease [Lactobacillus sp.]